MTSARTPGARKGGEHRLHVSLDEDVPRRGGTDCRRERLADLGDPSARSGQRLPYQCADAVIVGGPGESSDVPVGTASPMNDRRAERGPRISLWGHEPSALVSPLQNDTTAG